MAAGFASLVICGHVVVSLLVKLIMGYKINIFVISLVIAAWVVTSSANAKILSKTVQSLDLSSAVEQRAQINFDQLNTAEVVRFLGWTKNCDKESICGGCYFDSGSITSALDTEVSRDAPVKITASKPAFFTQQGVSVIQGNVLLRQPGREIAADQVTFYRDNKTGKIHNGVLLGSVNFRERGKLVVAKRGDLDFTNKVYSAAHGIYRLVANLPKGIITAWGRARSAVSDADGVLKLEHATYSACPPDATVWNLWSDRLTLDRNTGRGEAFNAVIFLKSVPVFYTPYFNFPIDKRRKSGFLLVTPGYSQKSGFNVNFPYYFNLAPNYDATFTPEFFSKRGVLLGGMFRYLTAAGDGSIDVDYIHHDRVFIDFRNAARISDKTYQRSLDSLKESSENRGFIKVRNSLRFGEHWQESLNVNYVTDDYFLQDFSSINSAAERDQLLNRADIGYAGDTWNFLGRAQIIQTLHPITNGKTQDQYKRMPQLNLSGDFPGGLGGLDYRLDSELVNFMHRDDFYKQTANPITGGARFNVMPSISLPLNWLGGSITPKIQLQVTRYSVHDQQKPQYDNNISRFYPLISLDSKALFTRELNFFHKKYTQTLEPRVFYLFVPLRNQDDVPIFDTYLPVFDFNQLFRANRFSGVDRVGDANQVALAITTKFLDDSGQEKFSAGLGGIAVIHNHQVVIKEEDKNFYGHLDPLRNENFSPLVGQAQYAINSRINASLDVAWDPSHHRFNTTNVNLQYTHSAGRVINFWYHYAIYGDQLLPEKRIDLSRLGAGIGWKIWQQWNIIGNVNYNTSYGRAQNYLYGLEYSSCCWAMRAVKSGDFVGIGIDGNKNYDSRIYFQFLLKGLW